MLLSRHYVSMVTQFCIMLCISVIQLMYERYFASFDLIAFFTAILCYSITSYGCHGNHKHTTVAPYRLSMCN